MFLRKECKKVKTHNYNIVPYCEDCSSYNIKVVRTCEDCGSHNIKFPDNMMDMLDDNRGFIPIYENREIYIYKCDICGKEFESKDTTNVISYDDGYFCKGPTYDGKQISLLNDLCCDCLQKVLESLNTEIDKLTDTKHITKVIKNLKNSK